jgi:hypothetical protein
MGKQNDAEAAQEVIANQLIAEAQAIANGGKPGDASPSPPPGQDGSPAGDPGAAPASPPPMDPAALADLALIVGDLLLSVAFGAAGTLQEPLRTEAKKAWCAVIVQYAPALQTVGPVGVLLSVYGFHAASLVAMGAWQKHDSVPGPSDGTAQAKQPS